MATKEKDYAKRLHELSQRPRVDVVGLESLVDDIRTFVAQRLWEVMVTGAGLVSELRQIKDLVLLGKGELYQVFINLAHPLLVSPPGPLTEHDVNRVLQQCARSLHLDDDVLVNKLRLTLTPPLDKKGGECGWTCLGVAYTTEWPLHTLFTPRVLNRYTPIFALLMKRDVRSGCMIAGWYTPIFALLMKLKRCQKWLHDCWMVSKNTRSVTPELSRLCHTRNHMLFLVNNFTYYMQVDVIETLFTELIDSIKSTHDIEQVTMAHDRFLSNLTAHSFVHFKPVSSRIDAILDLCLSFTSIMLTPDPSPQHQQQIDSIIINFERQSCLLFKVFTQGRNFNSNLHLSQLLLRLDYNRFYTRNS